MKKLGLIVLMLIVLSSGSNLLSVKAIDEIDQWTGGVGDAVKEVWFDGTYIYAGLETTPAQVIQIDPTTMATVDTWVGGAGEDKVEGLWGDGTYLYATFENAGTPASAIKIDPVTMTTVDTWTGAAGTGLSHDIHGDGTYIYVDLANGVSYDVVQINPATMTTVDTWTGATSAIYNILDDGTYIYTIQGTAAPANITRLDPATMNKVDSWVGAVGQDEGRSLWHDGTYLYAGLGTTPSLILKIDPATMLTVDSWTGGVGEQGTEYLWGDGSYIYATSQIVPGIIYKINPTTMTTVDSWTAPSLFVSLIGDDSNLYAGEVTGIPTGAVYLLFSEDAATITAPTSGSSYGKGQTITVTWTLPAGVSQTAYQIQVGSVGFAVVYEDTGKITSATSSGSIPAPSYSGAMALRVYYWDVYDHQSGASTAVTLTVTGDGGTPPPPPPSGIDTDGDGLNDDVDPDDDNDGIPDYMDQNPLTPDTPPPITPPIEIPEWVPPPIVDIIVKLYPWWQKYGAAVIIGCVVAAFLFYATGPKKSRRRGGLDVVLNPEKFLR